MIAALFVETGGCYFGLPDVDPWDEPRDARQYHGPWPVVAHPPCARWGSYWHGSPRKPHVFKRGADGGCFAAALGAVHQFGGVIEHPAGSSAWGRFGLPIALDADGKWHGNLLAPGLSCMVYQGHYGHRALKATWIYAVSDFLPVPQRGVPQGNFLRIDSGSKFGPDRAVEVMSHRERAATPPAFRDFLLSIAGSARSLENAA